MTRTRVLAATDEGAVVVSLPALGPTMDVAEYRRIGQGVFDPIAASLPDGAIALASTGGGAVYRRHGIAWKVVMFETPDAPVAALPGGPGRCAIVNATGAVTVVSVEG